MSHSDIYVCWKCKELIGENEPKAELARVDVTGNYIDGDNSVIVHQEPCATEMLRHGWDVA